MDDSTVSYERSIQTAVAALANGDRTTADKAIRAAIQAIKDLDGSHVELTSALIRIGTLKQEMGSHADAEELFRKALNISEAALGSDSLGLVPALTGLGASRILRGTPEKAEPVLARALTISEQHLGADHPDLVLLLNDLSRLYLKQAAYAFAEPLLLRLLALKRSKGEDHPEVATVLASLAAVHQALGRHEAAEQLWRRVLNIRERTLAPNHFGLATALEHLAETCAARGKLTEGLQLMQRAQAIREATLGVDHASVRAARERIADLQLQASEDSLSIGDVAPTHVATHMPRLPTGEHLGLAVAAAPLREKGAVALEKEAAPLSRETAPLSRETAPLSRETAPLFELEPPTKQPPAEKSVQVARLEPASGLVTQKEAPYLEVLQHIQEELEETDERQPAGGRAAVLFASVGSALRKHRAAAIIGVSTLTLPVVALAVAGAARAGQPGWVQQTTVAAQPRESLSVSSALPELTRSLSTNEAQKDSAAARGAEERRRPAEKRPESENIAIPTAPQAVRGLDSVVKAMGAPVRTLGESSPVQLASSVDNSLRGTAGIAAAGTAVRARLIGAVPTPRLNQDQLLRGGGGDVRVRFDVDTAGRPVMSTFSVVGTPNAALVAAVREVIPTMRFEPARSAWPESRPVVDRVEMGFQFTPRSK